MIIYGNKFSFSVKIGSATTFLMKENMNREINYEMSLFLKKLRKTFTFSKNRSYSNIFSLIIKKRIFTAKIWTFICRRPTIKTVRKRQIITWDYNMRLNNNDIFNICIFHHSCLFY